MLPRDLPPQVSQPDQAQVPEQPQAPRRHRGGPVLLFGKPNEQGQVDVIVRNNAAFGLPETQGRAVGGTDNNPLTASPELWAQANLGAEIYQDMYELQGMKARIASMKTKLESMQTNNSGS